MHDTPSATKRYAQRSGNKRVGLSIQLKPETYRLVKLIAEREGQSMNAVVEEVAERGLVNRAAKYLTDAAAN